MGRKVVTIRDYTSLENGGAEVLAIVARNRQRRGEPLADDAKDMFMKGYEMGVALMYWHTSAAVFHTDADPDALGNVLIEAERLVKLWGVPAPVPVDGNDDDDNG